MTGTKRSAVAGALTLAIASVAAGHTRWGVDRRAGRFFYPRQIGGAKGGRCVF